MRSQPWLLTLAVALPLIACGPAAQQAAPSPASDTPKAGGTINVRVSGDPFDWDLTDRGKSQPMNGGQPLAYNSLLGFKTGPDVKYDERVLQGELAERWEVSSDAKRFTYHLRPGLKWANLPPVNGRDLTAADVKWAFEYWSRTGWAKGQQQGQYEWMYEGMEGIDTPDPRTVVVRFKDGFAPFLYYSAADLNPVVPKDIYEQDGHLHDRIVGSNAFQLDTAASQKGTRWVWQKNTNYWEPGRPYLDQVRWLVITDDAAARAAFQAKQLDIEGANGSSLSTNDADMLRKANPTAQFTEYRNPAPEHVYLNTRLAPLNDIRVRKAVSLGVDRDEVLRVFTGGKGGYALAGAFPDTFTQEEIRGMLKYDPVEAKRLLAAAGHPNGVDIELQYPGKYFGDDYIQRIELLQAQLKKVGINLVFKSYEYADYSNQRRLGNFWISITNKYLEADVDSYVYIWHPTHRSNYAGVKDDKLTAMLEAQRREPDVAKRNQIVRDAVKHISDNVYGLALFYDVRYQFWQPYVKGFHPNAGSTSTWPLINTWLDK